mmetsp:Transcript_17998/g.30267  ORF Transcript_17998/g.30267 Transcript_17998/m.30267 type:complete len:183 (-) Transcript_17998:216-764(-)
MTMAKSKCNPITVIHKFGGRRCPPPAVAPAVKDWNEWDCDPTKTGKPRQKHAYGKQFPWVFDMLEKAYVLEGEATLTADDPAHHGAAPVRIVPGDMVTFPKGWKGQWEVHSFIRKRYAFFDAKGLQVDEVEEDDDDDAMDAGATLESKPQLSGRSEGSGKKGKIVEADGDEKSSPMPKRRRK